MTDPIAVGDLVVVVRWPHNPAHFSDSGLGYVFHVEELWPRVHCAACLADFGPAAKIPGDGRLGVPLAWLKRIPPLAELERDTTREEIHA